MFVPERINEILNTLNDGYDYKLIDELHNIKVESIDFNIDITQLNSNYINFLGFCYNGGYGTPINYDKAFELYTLAHEKGNTTATTNLAYCYEHGKGTSINLNTAFELYKLAHEKCNINATANLARCYLQGICVSRNIIKAIDLYIKLNDIDKIKSINILNIEYKHVLDYLKHINNEMKLDYLD